MITGTTADGAPVHVVLRTSEGARRVRMVSWTRTSDLLIALRYNPLRLLNANRGAYDGAQLAKRERLILFRDGYHEVPIDVIEARILTEEELLKPFLPAEPPSTEPPAH
ncbi:MAG TPA: hypothetical protein VN635_10590 [Conexibacter sp.]|nr:hypothetical protein [Conexibacter sp.]